MGAALSAYTTWDNSSGPWFPQNTEWRCNESTRQTYVWGRLYNGKDAKRELVKGGDSINDIVYLEGQRTAKRINPGTKTAVTNIQTGTRITAPWAFLRAQDVIEDQEVLLNGGGQNAQMYKNVRWQHAQRLVGDVNDKKDDESIGEVPNFNLQESLSPAGPRDPYSVHVFFNEYGNDGNTYNDPAVNAPPPLIGGLGGAGLIPAHIDAGGNAWTSVQTVDPRQEAKKHYRPYQDTYGAFNDTANTTDALLSKEAENLFGAFSRAFRRTTIDQYPWKPEYSDPRSAPNCIYTEDAGMSFMERSLRVKQAYFFGMGQRGGQDPHYNLPSFNATPLYFISALDAIELYSTGTAGTTSTSGTATHGGPRFIGMNGYKYVMPFIHESKHFEETPLMMPDGMPESRVKYVHLWDNILCRSRRRSFHLRPTGTINTDA